MSQFSFFFYFVGREYIKKGCNMKLKRALYLCLLIVTALLLAACSNNNEDKIDNLKINFGEGDIDKTVIVVKPTPPEVLTNVGTFNNSMSESINLVVREQATGATTSYTVAAGSSLTFTHALVWETAGTSSSVDMEIDVSGGEYNAVSSSNTVDISGVSTIYSPPKYSPQVTKTWTATNVTGTAPFTYKWYRTNVTYEGNLDDHTLMSTSSSYTASFNYMPIMNPKVFYLEVEVTDANGVKVSDSRKVTRYHSHGISQDF